MRYRMMGLGLFAAAGLAQCQPACTPETPGAVGTTTTVAETTTTQAPTTTTQPPATTTTQPTDESPVHFVEFNCDNLNQPNTQPILLWVILGRDAPAEGYVVTGGANGAFLWNEHVFESTDEVWVPWPRIGEIFDNTFGDSFTITVWGPPGPTDGERLYEQTFSAADLHGNVCAPALTGGIPSP